jgi:predicted transposase YbfD/YdcC
MASTNSASLEKHFAELTDPRSREGIYPLINIVAIALCAVICGADDFVAVARWGRMKRDWLAKFLDLSAGIPSHDRFNAIFRFMKPDEFEKCLLNWTADLRETTDGQIIAIDGKTLRRSFDKADGKSALHMVSAWATANHVALGQVITDAKSNEITAIPKLLELIEVSGSLVTIDAMGCQTEIAQKIVDQKADYVLAVKGNQPTLHQGIEDYFGEHLERDFDNVKVSVHQTSEKGHGRREQRFYYVCPAPKDLPDRERWPKLKAIGMAINITVRDGKERSAARYYILSRKLSARRFGEAVRGHWSIENHLHWQLDVTFGGGPMPGSQGPRRRELRRPAAHGPQHAQEQQNEEDRREEQTALRRLGRRLSRRNPGRQISYGAIALSAPPTGVSLHHQGTAAMKPQTDYRLTFGDVVAITVILALALGVPAVIVSRHFLWPSAAQPGTASFVGGIVFAVLFALVSLLNFHLSFIRPLLHQWNGGTEADYKFVSGIPLVGSIFGLPAAVLLPSGWIVGALLLVLLLLDTGGMPWLVYSMIYAFVTRNAEM